MPFESRTQSTAAGSGAARGSACWPMAWPHAATAAHPAQWPRVGATPEASRAGATRTRRPLKELKKQLETPFEASLRPLSSFARPPGPGHRLAGVAIREPLGRHPAVPPRQRRAAGHRAAGRPGQRRHRTARREPRRGRRGRPCRQAAGAWESGDKLAVSYESIHKTYHIKIMIIQYIYMHVCMYV